MVTKGIGEDEDETGRKTEKKQTKQKNTKTRLNAETVLAKRKEKRKGANKNAPLEKP